MAELFFLYLVFVNYLYGLYYAYAFFADFFWGDYRISSLFKFYYSPLFLWFLFWWGIGEGSYVWIFWVEVGGIWLSIVTPLIDCNSYFLLSSSISVLNWLTTSCTFWISFTKLTHFSYIFLSSFLFPYSLSFYNSLMLTILTLSCKKMDLLSGLSVNWRRRYCFVELLALSWMIKPCFYSSDRWI